MYSTHRSGCGARPTIALGSISDWVFVALCPPSFAALALENAGLLGGLIGWFEIALMNACIYAVLGWLIGTLLLKV
jgi:hypothetical protein